MSVPGIPAPAPVLRSDASPERLWLDDESWVDVWRGWLSDSEQVFQAAVDGVSWTQGKLFRYDRWVEEPRLGAGWSPGQPPAHSVLIEAHRALQHHYRVRFDGFAYAWYRNGQDSVAFHRDREMRWLKNTVIGVLSLGSTRPFLLRPRSNRYAHEMAQHGATHDLAPASGDLLVMGGACQARWEHAVPKVPGDAPRVSIQWRWTSRQGPMAQGGSYRAPRRYGDGQPSISRGR